MKKIGFNGLLIILFSTKPISYFPFTQLHCSTVVQTVIKRVVHLNIKSRKVKLIVLILVQGECIATHHWLRTKLVQYSLKKPALNEKITVLR